MQLCAAMPDEDTAAGVRAMAPGTPSSTAHALLTRTWERTVAMVVHSSECARAAHILQVLADLRAATCVRCYQWRRHSGRVHVSRWRYAACTNCGGQNEVGRRARHGTSARCAGCLLTGMPAPALRPLIARSISEQSKECMRRSGHSPRRERKAEPQPPSAMSAGSNRCRPKSVRNIACKLSEQG